MGISQAVRQLVAPVLLKVPRSSNGRTTGSGPVNPGSSPGLGTLRGSPRHAGVRIPHPQQEKPEGI